ncbi:hypothetical protein HRG_011630 [Hirsutella rhossiliensis]|uniref:Mid2 domain-containing protein n=1 Tax=Hirsutella rhossiliensis TaxID=111463 RepID=A0A9P8SCC3_9HYPO|nr:uncharacterized protein HRG_11630 [Hirsutella rhossiliensis]KAH0957483.1 hypothetical protein HRG_11630 [Hirsutella rhossiliensis]
MRRPVFASSSSSPTTTTSKLQLALLALGAATSLVSATPCPKDRRDALAPRADCGTPCGAEKQLCCGAGQACTTLPGDVATCVAAHGGGTYGLYTTTWTETRTYTSTIMTYWMPAPEPTAGVDCVPPSAEQQACGPICCAGWQTCAFQGQCSVKPGFVEPSTVLVTSDGKVTTRYSAPFRVTGTTTITSSGVGTGQPADSAAQATRTSDAGQAIGADGGTAGGGLSAGAIAGIVIGTLVGVALLLLLCFCCIARGLWGAVFGGKKKHEREERLEIHERYSHRASRAPSAYSRKDRHSGWFGGRRPAPAADRREKKKSSGGLWLAIAAGATTLLTLLNLKKDKRVPPRKVPPSSRYTYSDYTYSDATTSPSSSSSGRRTTYTRRTGDSRGPRSQYSRSSRRP